MNRSVQKSVRFFCQNNLFHFTLRYKKQQTKFYILLTNVRNIKMCFIQHPFLLVGWGQFRPVPYAFQSFYEWYIYTFKKNNFILHFCDFQHNFINNTNFNNFLTNNSGSNCFSASFTPSSLKVEHRCYASAYNSRGVLTVKLHRFRLQSHKLRSQCPF